VARQVDYLMDDRAHADFYLTQVVSHHDQAAVARFLEEGARRGLALPGVFGVFYYRSANPRTLGALAEFLPVPIEALTAEFTAGATPDDICVRTIRTLGAIGARHFYISNLPLARAHAVLGALVERARAA